MTRQPTVLISDDNPLVAKALFRLMRSAGFAAMVDTTSRNVFDLAKEHQPEVIILDINQAIDGRDLLAQIKKDPATKHLRVVMLTGNDDQFTRRLCLELGADEYAIKPFDPIFAVKVARMVREAMQARGVAYSASGP
jgi:DNA-binding response OmpR family regulator